jgi:hypothetical protein
LGVAERHRALRQRAWEYLRGPLAALPPGQRLGPYLDRAAVLVLGAAALGTGARPLELEVLLPDGEWGELARQARPSDLSWEDPAQGVSVRVRSQAWLRLRLAEPPELWLRQRTAVVQDPLDLLAPALRAALEAFRSGLGPEVERLYRALRVGFEQADAAADTLGRTVLLGRAVEAALALPVLARGEPYPPARWLVWYLTQATAEGDEIAALCARAAAGRTVPQDAYASLRRLVDEVLERAGYGDRLVRGYRALA